MERYVLIEKGPYKGQEARIIDENGSALKVIIYGREKTFDRSVVRFLPDNYKPFDSFSADAAERINMQAVTKTGDKADRIGGGMITAEKIKGVDITTYPAHDVYRGPMKGKTSASSGVNPIGVIMDNLSNAVSNILSKAKAPIDSGALGKTPPPLNNALYSRDEIPEAITKEKIDKFLEEWPDQDFDICPVIDPKVEELRMEQEATIKALRLRSRTQGKTNEILSLKNDQLQKEVKEVNRDMDAVLKDCAQLKDKNEFLKISLEAAEEAAATYKKKYKNERQAKFDYINEVEKGNNYRQGLKETIEALHEQIRERDDQAAAEETKTNKLADDLARANRIIDKLTEPGR